MDYWGVDCWGSFGIKARTLVAFRQDCGLYWFCNCFESIFQLNCCFLFLSLIYTCSVFCYDRIIFVIVNTERSRIAGISFSFVFFCCRFCAQSQQALILMLSSMTVQWMLLRMYMMKQHLLLEVIFLKLKLFVFCLHILSTIHMC